MGDNVGNNLHLVFSYLYRFPASLDDLSEQHGERFHQDISDMAVRYQGRWDAAMLAGYCWSIKRDNAFATHFRKSLQHKFMADIQSP